MCVCGAWQATEKDEAASMKDWILRYAEQSSEEEEEEEEGGKKACNPELEEKFDPVRTVRDSEPLNSEILFIYNYKRKQTHIPKC